MEQVFVIKAEDGVINSVFRFYSDARTTMTTTWRRQGKCKFTPSKTSDCTIVEAPDGSCWTIEEFPVLYKSTRI